MSRMERRLERLAALAAGGSTEGERSTALEKALRLAAQENLQEKLDSYLGKGNAPVQSRFVRLEDGSLFILDTTDGMVTLFSLVAKAFDCAIIRHAPNTNGADPGETAFTVIGTPKGVSATQDVCIAAMEVGDTILDKNYTLDGESFWARFGQELHNQIRKTQRVADSETSKALVLVGENIYRAATERAQSLSSSSQIARLENTCSPEVLAEAHIASLLVREKQNI